MIHYHIPADRMMWAYSSSVLYSAADSTSKPASHFS
jgi:hypothetical protein